jgi:hypothetical protein
MIGDGTGMKIDASKKSEFSDLGTTLSNFFFPAIYDFSELASVFDPGKLLSLVLCLRVRPEACPRIYLV